MGRSIKAQFKYADKKKANYVITIGDNEIETKTATIKNLQTGEEKQISIGDVPLTTIDFA